MQAYNDLRKRGPLPNEPNERVWHTPPCCKLMEDRTSWNPDKFSPVVGLFLDRTTCGFVTSEVVVPILYRLGFVQLVVHGGDGFRALGAGVHWNCDFAFFTCNNEVTKVSPICTVESVFQLLVKR